MTDLSAFLEALRRQQEKYLELAAMAEDQRKALAAFDVDALMGVVDRKRTIMSALESIERDLAPVKGRWAELRPSLDAASIREVELTIEETRRVLGDLIRLEDDAKTELEKQRLSTARQLDDVANARRARGAYGIE